MVLKIGVIGIQGDVEEHVRALESCLAERGERGEVVSIKRRGIVGSCDAIVIPGGESTTIGQLIKREGIADELREAAEAGKPILGTCAGMILLAKESDETMKRTKTGQPLLGLMDVRVKRNAFGRQRESFEVPLKLTIFDEPFPGVFIRAPCITHAAPDVDVLARLVSDDAEDCIVAARQGNIMALAFHPELTPDRRIHHYFISQIC